MILVTVGASFAVGLQARGGLRADAEAVSSTLACSSVLHEMSRWLDMLDPALGFVADSDCMANDLVPAGCLVSTPEIQVVGTRPTQHNRGKP